MKVTGIIMFLTTVTVAKHHHYSIQKSILKLKSNFFGKVNEDVHVIMQKIFNCVNLNANFTKQPNIKLLLTMHHDLSNIANKNFDMLNEIQNITTVNIDNQTQAMINTDTVVAEILNANNFNVYEKIKGRKLNHKHDMKTLSQNKKRNVTSEFGNSQEFMNFVIDFVEKVNNKRPLNDGKHFVPFRRNLKVWEPPSGLNIDEFNGTQTRRLYNGMETKVKKYPFIVSIHVMGEFTCAGCIISRDIIITAASCLQVAHKNEFFSQNPKSIYVRLGSDYTLRDGETIPIHKLYFHPLYDPESLRHNLALVKLERRIRFTRQQKRIRRILWDKTPGKLGNDTKRILILGWGGKKSDHNNIKYQKLTVDLLNMYDFNECKDIYSGDFVSDESFCAGFTKTIEGVCNGDVGGPGIVGEVLVGVVSFGAPVCGTEDTPTVFTKLGYYVTWIESIVDPQVKSSQSQSQSLYINSRRKQSGSFDYEDLKVIKPLDKNKEDHVHRDDFLFWQETKVLRDILTEMIKPNNTLVEDLLYGELYDDFKDLFASEEKEEDIKHIKSSANQTIAFPFVESDSKNAYVTVVATPPPVKLKFHRHHGTHKVGKINVCPEHESDTSRIKKNPMVPTTMIIPKKGKKDYETDSDKKEYDDTDNNYEISKNNDHETSTEEEKYSVEREGSLENSNVKKKYSIYRQDNENKEIKSKLILDKTGEDSDSSEKDSSELSDESYKKKINVRDSSRSFEEKNIYYSDEKMPRSDEQSEEIIKDSSEEESKATKENSIKNEDIERTDSNSEEDYVTKFKVTHGNFEELSTVSWGTIRPRGKSKYLKK